jgi:hypothetical protein
MKISRLIGNLTYLWLTWSLIGCAGVTVTPVTSKTDDRARGLRYYELSPYLLVHTDNKEGLVSKIVMLPDDSKKRSAKPYNFLASNTVTLKFTNGVLNDNTFEADGTAVPSAIVEVLGEAAKKMISGRSGETGEEEKSHTVPVPYLYKIIVHGDSITLHGGAPTGITEIETQKKL